MNQLAIFPPATHANDPSSSYKAEAKVTKSGKRKANYDKVLSELRGINRQTWVTGINEPTGAELAFIINMDKHEVRRRLSDMKAKGDAIQSGKRICRIAGTEAVTWQAV